MYELDRFRSLNHSPHIFNDCQLILDNESVSMEVPKTIKVKWQDHLNTVWSSESCREELITTRDGVQTLFDRLTANKEVANVTAPSIPDFHSCVSLLPDFESQSPQAAELNQQVNLLLPLISLHGIAYD